MRKMLMAVSVVALFAGCDETKKTATPAGASEAAAPAPKASPGATSTAATEPIRDVILIVTAVDTTPLVGRSVDLNSVKVQQAVSDRVFTIGESPDKAVYVMLDASLDVGAAERKIVVKAGQTVQISGVIERAAGAEIAAAKARGLSDQEAQAMKDQKLFLMVKKITFKS